MKRSMILDRAMLENLTRTPEYEHILVGTGKLARDMQKKLTLLGLKVAFLLGEKTDRDKGILSYSELASLKDPKQYRFIMCCDSDEAALQMEAQGAVYKFLGKASVSHPQLLLFGLWDIRYETRSRVIDSISCNSFIPGGLSYVVTGKPEKKDAFRIHIMGNCYFSDVVRHSKYTFAELLHEKLTKRGFSNVIYNWAQLIHPVSDNLAKLLRDVCFHKIDLLILQSSTNEVGPLSVATRNILPVKAGTIGAKPLFIEQMNLTGAEASNGIDHAADLFQVRALQQRIFIAFAKRYRFSFWDMLTVITENLDEKQGESLCGFTKPHLSRRKQAKEKLLATLDSEHTKDYTDVFGNVDDIYDMFMDYSHYSSEGNRLLAERCAADILREFGPR